MQGYALLCFIDYEQAFDRVKHQHLLGLLTDIELDGKDVRIIRNLYENQVATIKVKNEETEEIKICRGALQGCVSVALQYLFRGSDVGGS